MVKRILLLLIALVVFGLLFVYVSPVQKNHSLAPTITHIQLPLAEIDRQRLVSTDQSATETEPSAISLPFIGKHPVISKDFSLDTGNQKMAIKVYFNQNGSFTGADYNRSGFSFLTDIKRTEIVYEMRSERILSVPATQTKVSLVSMLEQIETWPNIDKFQVWRVNLEDSLNNIKQEQFIINVWGPSAFGDRSYARYKFDSKGQAQVIDNAAF